MFVDPIFWKNKKVLLTGHTGFKGSWLALFLQRMDALVYGVALTPKTSPNLFTVARVFEKMQLDHRGDVRDVSMLKNVFKKVQPEIIIHLAAQSLVREAYRDPRGTYETNILGTVNVLEAARELSSLKVLINVTSDKCYAEIKAPHAYSESDPIDGSSDPYSSSKACSELITAAYRRAFYRTPQKKALIGLATARAGNVIGGGDWAADRLIPDFVRACYGKHRLKIRYPNAVRPWQHVLEPLAGYLQLAQKLYFAPDDYSEAFNFGPSQDAARSVESLVAYLCDWWNSIDHVANQPCHVEIDDATPHHELDYLQLNSSYADQRLDWRSHWNVEQSLQMTLQWYDAYYRNEEMNKASLHQIDHFIDRIPITLQEAKHRFEV